jgi:hypothetical protein
VVCTKKNRERERERERDKSMPNYQTSSLQEKALTVHRELGMKNWTPKLVQVGYTAGKVRHSNCKTIISRYRIIFRDLQPLTKCSFTTSTAT